MYKKFAIGALLVAIAVGLFSRAWNPQSENEGTGAIEAANAAGSQAAGSAGGMANASETGAAFGRPRGIHPLPAIDPAKDALNPASQTNFGQPQMGPASKPDRPVPPHDISGNGNPGAASPPDQITPS